MAESSVPYAGAIRTHRFEMALTLEELRRLAPHLVEGRPVDARDRTVSGSLVSGARWSIAIGPPRERVIALFRFPIADVVLDLDGFGAVEAETFLARFHRVFQKGGG